MTHRAKIILLVVAALAVATVVFLTVYYRNMIKTSWSFGGLLRTGVPVENPGGYIPEANPLKDAPLNPISDVRVNPFRE